MTLNIKIVLSKFFKSAIILLLFAFVVYAHHRSFTRHTEQVVINATWQSDSSWGTSWIIKP